MRIASLTFLRNEADIVETFVRYHAGMLDRMFFVLHHSNDGTADILDVLRAEGMPLVIRREEDSAYVQSRVITALLHEAAAEAMWILPLDADEFLAARGENDPRRAIAGLPEGIVTLLPWKTYVPTPQDDRSEPNILRRLVHRRSAEHPQYCKILVPAALARRNPCIVPMGSHALIEKATGRNCPAASSLRLFLAHYPVRTEEQLKRKVIQGWQSHSALPATTPEQNFHWRQLHARCSSGAPLLPEELQSIATLYAVPEEARPHAPRTLQYEPLPCADFTLRCGNPVLPARETAAVLF